MIIALTLAGPIEAADNETPAKIVVTATRIEQPIEDVSASVQVISSEQLEEFSGRSLSEALQYAYGLFLRDLGITSSISIRGFDSGHTLILVNGLRRTEKYAGSNVNNIPLENVERIEIVRGPMSALYGSEALGGVINIITRAPGDKPEVIVRAMAGVVEGDQRQTGILHATANLGGKRFRNRVGVEIKSRGPYKEDDESAITDILGEKRGFVTYQGEISLNDTNKVSILAEYLKQDDSGTGLNARSGETYDRIEQEERYFVSGRYSAAAGIGLLDTQVSHGSSDATVNRGTAEDETTEFGETQAEASYAVEAGPNHFINIGVGYRLDDVSMNTMSKDVEREAYDLFAQDQWDITDTVNLTIGARYDDYSDFGDTLNPRAMLSWKPGPWAFRVGYATGFKAPRLLSLYMKDMIRGHYIIRGNENLQPEKSQTVEAAVSYRFPRGSLELIVHDSRIEDLITSVRSGRKVGRLTETVYQNIDKANIRGAEAIASVNISNNTRVTAGVEYLDAKDGETDERLTDRPRWQARLIMNTRMNKLTLEGRLRHVNGFWAADSSPVGAPNYSSNFTTVDVRADYAFNNSFTLFAGADNALDESLPENMAFRGVPDDPGARYYYAGMNSRF